MGMKAGTAFMICKNNIVTSSTHFISRSKPNEARASHLTQVKPFVVSLSNHSRIYSDRLIDGQNRYCYSDGPGSEGGRNSKFNANWDNS